MTRREDAPDEIVARHRDDTLCPPAAGFTSAAVESETWLSRRSRTDRAVISTAAGTADCLLRGDLPGAQQLNALRTYS
jgi:hypothetical protein